MEAMDYPIHPLTNKTVASSEATVAAYNKDSSKAVFADEMKRGRGETEWDIFGYFGTRDIVCLDCKFGLGEDVPLTFAGGNKNRKHFRHPQGFSPGGTGRHGETADHMYGKHLIVKWLEQQLPVVPGSVTEEYWVSESALRSDVKAELMDGTMMAFEVQRWQLNDDDWNRRHGKYERDGVKDVWLWAQTVTQPRLTAVPTGNLVFDVREGTLGLHLASRNGVHRKSSSKDSKLDPKQFAHPSRLKFQPPPTHYVSAPLNEWVLEIDGSLTPPDKLLQYLAGDATVRHELLLEEQESNFRYEQRRREAEQQRLDAKHRRFKDRYDWWLNNTPRGKQELVDRQQRLEDLRAKWRHEEDSVPVLVRLY